MCLSKSYSVLYHLTKFKVKTQLAHEEIDITKLVEGSIRLNEKSN